MQRFFERSLLSSDQLQRLTSDPLGCRPARRHGRSRLIGVGEPESAYGLPEIVGQFRQPADLRRALAGARRGLLGDFGDLAHRQSDASRRGRLLSCRLGDRANQSRQLLRHRVDLGQGLAGSVGHARSLDDLARGLFHAGDCLVGFHLDRLDQAGDLTGGGRRTLGQPLDFLGHDREAAPRLARGRRLNRGVQGQNAGAVGDVVDQGRDFADLPRRLA